MNTPTISFPNEVWMRVFSYILDTASLRAVVLTSRRFRNLGMDELLHTLVWKTGEKAGNNLEFWEDNADLVYIPTSLSISVNSRHDSGAIAYPRILNQVSWFHNLGTLSLSNGFLPPVFYHVLLSLPNLTHLKLHSCHVPDAPAHFPFSFPSFWDKDADDIAIRVTHLSIRNVLRYPTAFDPMAPPNPHSQIDLFNFLPALVSLTLEHLPTVGIPVLQQLTSLTLLPTHSPEHTVTQLNEYLPFTSNLLHLKIGAPATQAMREAPPPIVPTVPLLETFVGPEFAALSILGGSPALVSLTVNSPLAKMQDALDLIEQTNPLTLRALELNLVEWDDEIILAITHRLLACRSAKVTFRFSEPSEDFLFNLGVEHLPLLTQLHTLHVHARAEEPKRGVPLASDPDDEYYLGQDEIVFPGRVRAPKETRVVAVAPAEDACAEALAAWTRYNKELSSVRFVSGREWRRRKGKGRWGVERVGE
ncbi:hypothetical protein B0H17DRAFT_1180766 [Mycena rosella]|uniref:F-box domain-containing protein n=1 Tax=Mycena rosella TaxID=1033263 RepID=A0AAD7DBZ8_MYCRO|nr:hypothetical protein B0H17DRAFT_1180766 [Mycena rosella]